MESGKNDKSCIEQKYLQQINKGSLDNSQINIEPSQGTACATTVKVTPITILAPIN